MSKYILGITLQITFFFLSQKIEGQVLDSAFLKAKYNFKFRPDSNSLNIFREDVLILESGQKFSKFYSYYKMYLDSTINAQFNNQDNSGSLAQSVDLRGIPTGSTKVFFKNNKTGVFTIRHELGLYNYQFADSAKDLKWIITIDTATFLGYKCSKAYTTFRGRSYEAWFALEITLPVGPHLFTGLPGLVLKLKEQKGNFEYNLVSLEFLKEKKPILFEAQKTTTVTRKQYRKLVKFMYENPDGFAASQGMIFRTKSIDGETNPPPPPKPPYNPIELE
jgi:GLPGLI family protein